MYQTYLKLIQQNSGYDAICSIKRFPKKPNSHSNYIIKLKFFLNDKEISVFNLGPRIPNDPVFGVHISEITAGDKVTVQWTDTHAARGIRTVRVS